jgi:hypothetical protein
MVAGPIKAAASPPQNTQESAVESANPFGRLGLAAYRMTAEPAINSIQQAASATNGHPSYNQNGDYTPTKADLYMDALPIVGPWARNVENDAQKNGAVAGLAGLATDVLAPKVAGHAAGLGMQALGKAVKFAASTGPARQVALTRMIVPGSPTELLTRALKPSVANPDFESQMTRALPDIVKENPAPGVAGFGQAADAAKTQEQNWYQGLLRPHANNPVDMSPVSSAQMNSIPTIESLESPGIIGKTESVSSQYIPRAPKQVTTTSPILDEFGNPITRTTTIPGEPPRTLGLSDTLRQESNQKLHSLYEKSGGDRYAALANPETARTFALNNALREVTYGNLSDASGVPQAEIARRQGLYGDLSDISDVVNKRNIVFGRQSPYSLQESIAMSGGDPIRSPLAYLGQRILKNSTDPNAMTNAAIDRFRSSGGPSLEPGNSLFSKASSAAGNALDGAGKALRRSPLVKNPFFYSSIAPKR